MGLLPEGCPSREHSIDAMAVSRRGIHRTFSNADAGLFPPFQREHAGANPPNGANEHESCVTVRRVRSALHTRRHSQKAGLHKHARIGAGWRNKTPTWYFQDHLGVIPRCRKLSRGCGNHGEALDHQQPTAAYRVGLDTRSARRQSCTIPGPIASTLRDKTT
jgi:hypothetical protein